MTRKLTIFEGPDGGGKTTAAHEYAKKTEAVYAHFGTFKQVKHIGRLYVEAMLPALLGCQDVVMDRSWHSEPIYGLTMRGESRLGRADLRMLDRLAMVCETTLVLCQPPIETVLANWGARHAKGGEYVEASDSMSTIYRLYDRLPKVTDLPTKKYDYTTCEYGSWNGNALRTDPHHWRPGTAGNIDAPITIVGESFGEIKAHDPLYQWPFASFSEVGCSRWLTDHLDEFGVAEHQLFWVNADHPNFEHVIRGRCAIRAHNPHKIYALGAKASERLEYLPWKPPYSAMHHPQYAKRFKAGDQYGLGPDILSQFSL